MKEQKFDINKNDKVTVVISKNLKRKLLPLGQYCKEIRQSVGLKVDNIAIRADTSVSNVRHFEIGDNNSALILIEYLKIMTEKEKEWILKGFIYAN